MSKNKTGIKPALKKTKLYEITYACVCVCVCVVEPMFSAMCECQAMHPDPDDEDSENDFEGEEYDVEEAGETLALSRLHCFLSIVVDRHAFLHTVLS